MVEFETREEKGFKYKVIGEKKNGETGYFVSIDRLRKHCRGSLMNEECYWYGKGKRRDRFPTTARPCELNNITSEDYIHLNYDNGSIKDFYIIKAEYEKLKRPKMRFEFNIKKEE